MTLTQLKQQVTSLLNILPESKLVVVYELAQFLIEREHQSDWMNAQSQSVAYQEWVSRDNDIYDEVFGD